MRALNGDIVLLAAGEAGIVGQVDHGRLYKDGEILLQAGDECIAQRRRLSFAGVVSIALALSPKGDLSGDPDVIIAGLPNRTRQGAGMDEVVDSAIFETFESLPRGKRRDPDAVANAIHVERAVRNAVNAAWGKKPAVHVLVVEVGFPFPPCGAGECEAFVRPARGKGRGLSCPEHRNDRTFEPCGDCGEGCRRGQRQIPRPAWR